jgi:hypothetical protein
MWVSGLSQGSAKLFITSSNLVIASSGELFLYSSGHPGVKRNVLSGAFFFRHPDVFLFPPLYTIFAVFLASRFGDVVRIGLY